MKLKVALNYSQLTWGKKRISLTLCTVEMVLELSLNNQATTKVYLPGAGYVWSSIDYVRRSSK